jgi:hypothetical protein
MGIMKTETASEKSGEAGIKLMIEEKDESKEDLSLFQICPKCNLRTLKVEGGCYTCVNPECGYTKCD